MEHLPKRKPFEMGLPSYAFNKASDIIMFTYSHAYFAVFAKRNISRAIKLFRIDFNIENEYDNYNAMACYQRVREKFLDERRLVYVSSEINDTYVRCIIDVMIWAWVTFMRKHVNPNFATIEAVEMFSEYFSMKFTLSDIIMHARRFDDIKRPIETLPIEPMRYNMK